MTSGSDDPSSVSGVFVCSHFWWTPPSPLTHIMFSVTDIIQFCVWRVHVPTSAAVVFCAPALVLLTVSWCLCGTPHSACPGWGPAASSWKRRSSQATEGLITDSDQGQPCGNCVQLTEGMAYGGGSAVCRWFCFVTRYKTVEKTRLKLIVFSILSSLLSL